MDTVLKSVMDLIGGSREAGLSILFAFVVPHLLQWLKGSNIPLMKEGAAKLNRSVAFVTAILASVGVHVAFLHDANGWALTLSGAHVTIGAFLLDVTRQFMLQQGRYHVMENGPGSVNVTGAMKRGILGTLLLVGLAGGAIACGDKKPAQLPDVAATVALTEAQLRAQVAKSVIVLDVALENIRDINAAEKIAEPQMNDFTRRSARAAMTAAVDAIQIAAKGLRAGVSSYADLKQKVDPVLTKLGELQKFVTGLTAGEKAAGGFGSLVGGLVRFAFAMLNPDMFGYGEPALAGGAR